MKCPRCKYENPVGSRFCSNCNHILESDKKKSSYRRNRTILYITIAIAVVGLIAFIIFRYVFNSGNEQNIRPSGIDPSSLANVEFSSEVSQYPNDWPADLIFPQEFYLVDSSSGTLPEGSKDGWSMKLRYDASSSEAEEIVIAFLEDNGWSIINNTPLDSIGYSILIRQDQESGIVIIDSNPKDASKSLILATIFK